MTSIVTVKAHCGSIKRVKVTVADKNLPGKAPDVFYLESGESADRAVWDDRTVTVCEELK